MCYVAAASVDQAIGSSVDVVWVNQIQIPEAPNLGKHLNMCLSPSFFRMAFKHAFLKGYPE